jgi:hypothetical protein
LVLGVDLGRDRRLAGCGPATNEGAIEEEERGPVEEVLIEDIVFVELLVTDIVFVELLVTVSRRGQDLRWFIVPTS